MFGYTGKPLDEATGLQNNLHRWYDSDVGRWMSEDPIGFGAGDANLGRYVANRTSMLTDPSGQVVPWVVGGLIAAWWWGTTPDVAHAPTTYEDSETMRRINQRQAEENFNTTIALATLPIGGAGAKCVQGVAREIGGGVVTRAIGFGTEGGASHTLARDSVNTLIGPPGSGLGSWYTDTDQRLNQLGYEIVGWGILGGLEE